MRITDCHVHINPVWEMRPEARALLTRDPHEDRVERYTRHPEEFLEYLDRSGIDRAVLVNYVSPTIVGYTEKTNEFVSEFARADPRRLIAVGSVLPSHAHPGAEVRRLATDLGIRALKVHPSHQLFSPNGYLDGTTPGLREIYEEAQRLRLPILVHTGTSVFPGARNRFAHPMLVEDVALDFPELTIVLAHGGRPFWTAEALFLARRFPKVYLEVSSVPPKKIPEYFPGLERLPEKVLFGSDWPGPGVKDIGENLRAFRALPYPAPVLEQILEKNPENVFPSHPPS